LPDNDADTKNKKPGRTAGLFVWTFAGSAARGANSPANVSRRDWCRCRPLNGFVKSNGID
jgi:hypothetical protein